MTPSASHSDSDAPRRRKPKWRDTRFRKVMRVLAYVSVVGIAGGALAARSAYGSVKQSALELGSELGKLGDIGAKTPIILNGHAIHVGSSIFHGRSVSETLDRAEALCHSGSVPVDDDALRQAAADTGGALVDSENERPAMALMRHEDNGRGVVVCFAAPEGQLPPMGIKARAGRVMKFLRTGNLDALGRLRYLWARPTDSGGTHLVRVWTDEPFNLYSMTAKNGQDTPGSDPVDVPRPPESVRMLTATVKTTAYAVRIYETQLAPSGVAEAYDSMMPKRNWKRMSWKGNSRTYQRGDMTVFVSPAVDKGRVLVSLLHMGTDSTREPVMRAPGPRPVAQ
jgi:hypothetical protein